MKLICTPNCVSNESSLKGNGWSLFGGILLLLMPKCAFCWAAYMGFFSSLGLMTIPYRPWFQTAALVLFLLTLFKLLYNSVHKKNFLSFGLALLSGSVILLQKFWMPAWRLDYWAIMLMTIAVFHDPVTKIRKEWLLRFRQQTNRRASAGGH